jgi:hypothetical protein
LGETIHFEQNTMVDRTGQARFGFFIHRLRAAFTRLVAKVDGLINLLVGIGDDRSRRTGSPLIILGRDQLKAPSSD